MASPELPPGVPGTPSGTPSPDVAGWTIAIAGLNPSEADPATYILLENAAVLPF